MKPHSAASSQPRSSIASRARQIKDHEAEPFLSIDLMPQGSTTKSESKTTDQARSSLRGSSCQTLISAISSESVTQRSGKNSVRSGKDFVQFECDETAEVTTWIKNDLWPNATVQIVGPKNQVQCGQLRTVCVFHGLLHMNRIARTGHRHSGHPCFRPAYSLNETAYIVKLD
ncbi:hypothetical protein RRG08_026503 [Elysia crispata]|uniref:Uncharacterized protein n=1 Tax=Elysia crispata TaxID=231223 RepID=A0AAE1CS52_9GAST|nr:hypothetical protein RRG08_026503 [Elysia crispata]